MGGILGRHRYLSNEHMAIILILFFDNGVRMSSIDLAWLAVFEEIYRSRNVSRAAERLGLTQGACSTALGKLRDYYDDRLFSRTARGMLPTPRADEIYPLIRDVRLQLERARSGATAFDASSATRHFTVCMTDISEVVLLPTLTNHLRHHAPQVDIEAERISSDSARRLEDGSIDLAVGFMPQLESGFYQRVLFEQSFVCIAAQAHPRIQGRVSRAQYLKEAHLTVKTSGTGHHIVDRQLADQDVKRRIALQVTSFLAVAQIVAESELIATVPSHFANVMASRERIQVLPLPFKIDSYQVKIHWHERFHADPANAWLRQQVADLMPPAQRRTRARSTVASG